MCDHLKMPDGTVMLVCGGHARTKYCACGRVSEFECDWKVPSRKSGTCDAPICARHVKEVAPGKHLCPLHQRMWDDWQKRHPGADLSKGEQKSLFGEAA